MGRHREFPVENDHTITPPSGRLPREITPAVVLWFDGRFKAESLPVPSVKIFRLQRREINTIDAARVDVDLVRI
jgi:hypothetical protein